MVMVSKAGSSRDAGCISVCPSVLQRCQCVNRRARTATAVVQSERERVCVRWGHAIINAQMHYM